jgi:hypothetical protein
MPEGRGEEREGGRNEPLPTKQHRTTDHTFVSNDRHRVPFLRYIGAGFRRIVGCWR